MAIYPYKCAMCGAEEEIIQSISSYSVTPNVPNCPGHGLMQRKITMPMVTLDIQPWASYVSPIDGAVITSRSEQREHMTRHGVVMFDDIAPDIERNRRQIQERATADLKADIAASIHMLEAGHKPTSIPEAELIPTT